MSLFHTLREIWRNHELRMAELDRKQESYDLLLNPIKRRIENDKVQDFDLLHRFTLNLNDNPHLNIFSISASSKDSKPLYTSNSDPFYLDKIFQPQDITDRAYRLKDIIGLVDNIVNFSLSPEPVQKEPLKSNGIFDWLYDIKKPPTLPPSPDARKKKIKNMGIRLARMRQLRNSKANSSDSTSNTDFDKVRKAYEYKPKRYFGSNSQFTSFMSKYNGGMDPSKAFISSIGFPNSLYNY